MRTGLAYTCARILLLVISMGLLYLAGARGLLLLVLAFGVSALASYVLLSKQRDLMSGALNRRLAKVGQKAAEFSSRIDEGAAAEDDDDAEDYVDAQDAAPADDAAPAAGLAEVRDGS
jgi:hypothetical protein